VLSSLILEIASLSVLAALPARSPDLPIVLVVAFVAALQSANFPRVEGLSYSSVMTTGNLRRSFEMLAADGSVSPDPLALHRAAVFGGICIASAIGAALGGLFTARFGNAAVSGAAVLLFLALLLCMRRPLNAPRT
jgi:uncharacterized membrane protein YoaK (UPF0700 family)